MDGMLLPIGTVVTLKGGNKKLMITAFCVTKAEGSKDFYDYSACLYPEGLKDSSSHYLFNISDIDSVHYLGYFNEEEEAFKALLYKKLSENKSQFAMSSSINNNKQTNEQSGVQSVQGFTVMSNNFQTDNSFGSSQVNNGFIVNQTDQNSNM